MKTVTYPIPHDEEGGTLFLIGKPDAPRIVLMCAGFPDNHSAFMSLAERLADKNCFVGVACLPGYDKMGWKDGYTFQDWVYCLQEAAKALRGKSTTVTPAKFTGIFHDWGCVAGEMFTSRAIANGDLIPDELILFDVCVKPHPDADTSNLVLEESILGALYSFAVVFAYQIILAISFVLQRYISKHLAVLAYVVGFKIIGWLHLVPLGDADNSYVLKRLETMDRHHLTYMAYPYFYFWKAVLTPQDLQTCHLPLDLQKTPVMYLYGADKNINFHDPPSVALLQEEAKKGHRSKVVKVESAGHWLYAQQEDVCFEEISKFLEL